MQAHRRSDWREAQGIGYKVEEIERAYEEPYPEGDYGSTPRRNAVLVERGPCPMETVPYGVSRKAWPVTAQRSFASAREDASGLEGLIAAASRPSRQSPGPCRRATQIEALKRTKLNADGKHWIGQPITAPRRWSVRGISAESGHVPARPQNPSEQLKLTMDVIDTFLVTFSPISDSGLVLLAGRIVATSRPRSSPIDITRSQGLFWALSQNTGRDRRAPEGRCLCRLLRVRNRATFPILANIVFDSFADLALDAAAGLHDGG